MKIVSETFKDIYYCLIKEDDGTITIREDYTPYTQWSNCREEQYNLRQTPKRLVIIKNYYNDLGGQTADWSDKTYTKRNDQLDKLFDELKAYEETGKDETDIHAELSNLFNEVDRVYEAN